MVENDPYQIDLYFVLSSFQLCFKKEDILTVTQAVDGGWWEGTLGDKTGWFPSNYVTDLKQGKKIWKYTVIGKNTVICFHHNHKYHACFFVQRKYFFPTFSLEFIENLFVWQCPIFRYTLLCYPSRNGLLLLLFLVICD